MRRIGFAEHILARAYRAAGRVREGTRMAIVWSPSDEYVERANVTRFMRANGISTCEELVRRSTTEIEWFWDAVVKDLGLEFFAPYERVLDTSRGAEWRRGSATER
jgi:hypothetical protein